MSKAIPDTDYMFLPMALAVAGPSHGFVQVFSSRWWSVCPQRGLRFYNRMKATGQREQRGFGSPQCNVSRNISERLSLPSDDVIYIERVFVPISLDDWRD